MKSSSLQRNCRAGMLMAGVAMASVSANATGWTSFADPTEHAFTAEVPQGWIVKGGLERKSDVNVMGWLTLASRDGATTIFIHDPNVPHFVLPGHQRQEGTWTTNGVLGPAAVLSYEPGARFAAKYGRRAFASSCGDLQLKDTRDEPDLVQRKTRQYQELAARVGNVQGMPQIDGGSALFTCQIKGKPYVAVAFAVTSLTPGVSVGGSNLGGAWSATVMGYRSPAELQADSDHLVREIDVSFTQDPAFQTRMVQVTQQKLEEIRENGARGMAMLQRQAAQENAMLRQQYENSSRMLQENHDAFMAMMDQQEEDRNYQFDDHMYQKAVNQQNEMLYINNQHCIAWYGNDTHQGCRIYAND